MGKLASRIIGFSNSMRTLEIMFVLALLMHFFWPLYDNPLDNLFSDPKRHWSNGKRLFEPGLIGSMDPKLYQLIVYMMQTLSFGSRTAIGAMCGLMSACTIYFWYRTCREIYRKESALFLGLIMGICPSLLAIYSYFMNETITLFVLGLAFWLTFRAVRKKTFTAALAASIVLVLTLYTRMAMLPVTIAALWFMFTYINKKRAVALIAFLFFCLCTVLASLHSYKALKVYAPFGFRQMNQFYFYSNCLTFIVKTKEYAARFSSPSYYYEVGYPLFVYESKRTPQIATVEVDVKNGMQDWNKEIARVKATYTWEKFYNNVIDNTVFLLFANSWPDSSPDIEHKILLFLNFHFRWMWAPLIILLLCAAPFTRATKPEMLIICCAYGLIITFIFQQSVMIEGRYRKPVEPLLIISAYAILRNKALNTARLLPQLTKWHGFLRDIYLKPFTKRL